MFLVYILSNANLICWCICRFIINSSQIKRILGMLLFLPLVQSIIVIFLCSCILPHYFYSKIKKKNRIHLGLLCVASTKAQFWCVWSGVCTGRAKHWGPYQHETHARDDYMGVIGWVHMPPTRLPRCKIVMFGCLYNLYRDVRCVNGDNHKTVHVHKPHRIPRCSSEK